MRVDLLGPAVGKYATMELRSDPIYEVVIQGKSYLLSDEQISFIKKYSNLIINRRQFLGQKVSGKSYQERYIAPFASWTKLYDMMYRQSDLTRDCLKSMPGGGIYCLAQEARMGLPVDMSLLFNIKQKPQIKHGYTIAGNGSWNVHSFLEPAGLAGELADIEAATAIDIHKAKPIFRVGAGLISTNLNSDQLNRLTTGTPISPAAPSAPLQSLNLPGLAPITAPSNPPAPSAPVVIAPLDSGGKGADTSSSAPSVPAPVPQQPPSTAPSINYQAPAPPSAIGKGGGSTFIEEPQAPAQSSAPVQAVTATATLPPGFASMANAASMANLANATLQPATGGSGVPLRSFGGGTSSLALLAPGATAETGTAAATTAQSALDAELRAAMANNANLKVEIAKLQAKAELDVTLQREQALAAKNAELSNLVTRYENQINENDSLITNLKTSYNRLVGRANDETLEELRVLHRKAQERIIVCTADLQRLEAENKLVWRQNKKLYDDLQAQGATTQKLIEILQSGEDNQRRLALAKALGINILASNPDSISAVWSIFQDGLAKDAELLNARQAIEDANQKLQLMEQNRNGRYAD